MKLMIFLCFLGCAATAASAQIPTPAPAPATVAPASTLVTPMTPDVVASYVRGQTYVDNIFNAKAEDYRAATVSVFHGADTASSVLLPMIR